ARSTAERPDAVFCVNDLLAVGVLQAFAFRHQIAVPEEIALVGYDDIAFARSTVVPLTSVSQPADLMGRAAPALPEEQIADAAAPVGPPPSAAHPPDLVGRAALALLAEQIADASAPPRHVSFTPTLVERGSTTG